MNLNLNLNNIILIYEEFCFFLDVKKFDPEFEVNEEFKNYFKGRNRQSQNMIKWIDSVCVLKVLYRDTLHIIQS